MPHDVIIIGGGPAGMSALLWCCSFGLSTILLEPAQELGGQLLRIHHEVEGYLGVSGETGTEARDRFCRQLRATGAEIKTSCILRAVDLRSHTVVCDGVTLSSRAIIIATGVRPRTLGVPGEEALLSRGAGSSAMEDQLVFAGKRVCVVGGGDSAVEDSLVLSQVASRVTLVHHSNHFRARPEWVKQMRTTGNITIKTPVRVKEITGKNEVEGVRLEDLDSFEETSLDVDGVLIRIGVVPNTDVFSNQIESDDIGYVITNRSQETSLPGVFAAGDVCAPVCMSIPTAVGHGAIAAKAILQLFDLE